MAPRLLDTVAADAEFGRNSIAWPAIGRTGRDGSGRGSIDARRRRRNPRWPACGRHHDRRGDGLALFPEPIRGTHTQGAQLMILGLRVGPMAEPTLICINVGGRPCWFALGDVTFDWRWSDRLGRWGDLEEITELTPGASAVGRAPGSTAPFGRIRS